MVLRTAALDVGTNTVRILVADYEGGENLIPILRQEVITRLGGGFIASRGRISTAAMDRTITALSGFKKAMSGLNVDKTIAVATSVVREARNGKDFIEKVKEKTGLEIIVISGETEAKLACRGALLPVDCEYDQAFIFDIGGGSTEFILTQGTVVVRAESIELGVVHLTERYLCHDLPQEEELAAVDQVIRFKIEEVKKRFKAASLYPLKRGSRTLLIGIAGTPTTLAAVDLKLTPYDRERVTNHLLEIKRIREIFQELVRRPAYERLSLPGLQRGREDLIVPGIRIILGVMEVFGFPVLRVIDSGILEGLVLSYSSSPGTSIPCFSRR